MAFPDKLMADDESLVEHLHPHWITLVPAVLWFLLICGLAGVGLAFLPGGTSGQVLLWVIVAAAVVLLCWLSVGPFLRWRSTHYVLTTHRVLIRRGILTHTGRDIPLARINDVSYRQNLWDRIVNAGSLTIESASENGQETLTDIPHADDVQQSLNRLVELDSQKRSWPGGQVPPGALPPGPAPTY